MSVAIVIGTRPEIIKMASVIFELERRSIPFQVIHTGQHYDHLLSEVFFDDLGLPRPNCFLSIGTGSPADQTGRAMISIEKELVSRDPDVVLVQGDTNTVLAGALAAAKSGYPVGHVEAGLRSYDLRMPEEYNRRLTDHISAYLFAPTEGNVDNLRKESVLGKIFVTGSTVIDACNKYVPIAEGRSGVLSRISFKRYCLATVHRTENVDDPEVLRSFAEIFDRCPVPVVFPVHPRTKKLLKATGIGDRLEKSANVQLLEPQGYFDFLTLMKNSQFILTDSGGIQEEATSPSINKKVFVLRLSTERPETLASGHATVVGTDAERVLPAIDSYVIGGCKPPVPSFPFGKGDAARIIVEKLVAELKQ